MNTAPKEPMQINNHIARPESWNHIARRAAGDPYADSIAELRARVQRLEQAQQQQQQEVASPDTPIDRLDLTLRETMRLHALWIRGDEGGRRADLSWFDLRGAIFRGADMRDVDLSLAELAGAIGLSACPHIVSTDEGTSYCSLAEQPARAPAEPTDRMDMTLGELLRLNELWNAGETGGRQLNLSGLDLSGADLSDTDLRDADLSNAYMRSANLTRANLRRANLHGASTRGAIGLPKPAPVEPATPRGETPTPAVQRELVSRVTKAIRNAILEMGQ